MFVPISLLILRITNDALRQTVEARVRAADSSMQLSASPGQQLYTSIMHL